MILRILFFILSFFPLSNAFALENSVCATVKIEIKQELTLERQAFDANMKINNGFPNLTLANVNIQVKFQDKDGNSVIASSNPDDTNALFFIRVSSMTGVTNSDISGSGTVPPATTADIHWLIIPAIGAGKGVPSGTLYYVGATLSYKVGSEQKTVEVSPDYIYVKPMPELSLDYFFPYDVYSDDPFTQEIEPPIPFTLGVRAKNTGMGTARDVKIESAQPKIVENVQGLLVNFLIIESWINNQFSANNLLVNFGNILPNTSSICRWMMECSLTGRFTEFTATYTHSNELGGRLTSVISALNTHTLIHDVLDDLPGRDVVKDFLARDSGVYKLYESDGMDTEVNDWSSNAALLFSNQIGTKTFYNLTVPATSGFMYAQVPDPYSGQKMIKEVIRSDGKNINLQNTWLSKTKNAVTKEWEYYFNIFDGNTTAVYSVVFDDNNTGPKAPILQFISDHMVTEGERLSFIVEASDPDGTIPVISASPLPAGAAFVDRKDGSGLFDWAPAIGQAGKCEITFKASDGTLQDLQTVVLTIQSIIDSQRDFSLAFSPASRKIVQGQTTSYTVDIQPIQGFNSEVTLIPSLSSTPSQGSINFAIVSPVIPPATGELTVNTTEDLPSGIYSINLAGSSATKTHSISTELVVEEKLDILTDSLPNSRVGESYTKTLELKGGVSPYVWSVISGSLPNGLVLDAALGTISGIPLEKGYFSFTVEVKDASNPVKFANKDFTMVVWPQPLEAFGEGALFKVTDSTVIDGNGVVLLFKDGYKEVYSFADAKTNNTAVNDVFRMFTTPLINLPLYKGQQWSVTEGLILEGYPVEVKYKVLGTDEEIVVPSGTFKDCVEIEETITFPGLTVPGFAAPHTILRWFAPKIGIIKTLINWYDNSVSTGLLQQYSVADPKNNDYFPLSKDNYWTFVWDKYKSLENFSERYTIADFDSNIIAGRLKNPYVSINDLYPAPNQGINANTLRVPCDTSVIGRIQSSLGIDEEKLAMRIRVNAVQYYNIVPVIKQAGLGKANDYWVSFDKPIRVSTGLTADTLTDSTASWTDGSLIGMTLNPNIKQDLFFTIINNTSTSITVNGNLSLYATTGDSYQILFTHGNVVDVQLGAQDTAGNIMPDYAYSFKAETQGQHDTAKQNLPGTILDTTNPNEYVLSVTSENMLKGAKIKYSPDEPIAPRFGPLDEIPKLDIALGAGLPVNLEPAVVFRNPVTLILPCPGASNLASLEIYGYHPALGWRPASEFDGWIAPNSRINHTETTIPAIEFQVYHFTGVQIGKPISSVRVYSANAYYYNGKSKNTLSADIKGDFVNNSMAGWLKFYGINQKGTINAASTLIKEIKHGSNGEAIIKGNCKVNNRTGYVFTSIMQDSINLCSGKDVFSIEITGPNGFRFSVNNQKIDGGDIKITWK